MAQREERQEQARKHLSLVKGALSSETAKSIEDAFVYEDGEGRSLELPEPAFESTVTKVTTSFAPRALSRAKGKAMLVDPGSFTRPGGNYEGGSFGPEQVLCSESNLYPVLQGLKKKYYDGNRGYSRSMLFTDRALYVPGIVFLQDGAKREADVLVIPEPNRARALENHRSEREVDNTLVNRIESIMRIAAVNECETLIVGAFGCGREGYDPKQVVDVFQAWIDAHPGAIQTVVFAVPRAFVGAFDDAFKEPEPVIVAASDSEEDAEEDEEWRNIELPEGITLR